jgi:hypothetical protein
LRKFSLAGSAGVILLLVTIGVLNVGLGFGLAMYYGYGPPGLSGILESLGSMPPATQVLSSAAAAIGAPVATLVVPPVTRSPIAPQESLAEEAVLGEVRDMATAAQSAIATEPAATRE